MEEGGGGGILPPWTERHQKSLDWIRLTLRKLPAPYSSNTTHDIEIKLVKVVENHKLIDFVQFKAYMTSS